MTASFPRYFTFAALVAAPVMLAAVLAAPQALAQNTSPAAGQGFGQDGFLIEDSGRSGAMRAPLNIVPPVMQSALGQKPNAPKASEKLAPRVAARQSKRAVRAVAAAPGSTGEIVQVGQLGALQDAPIGLESGFGSDLWRGARLAFITGQMARLPERIKIAALRNAELVLYRSTTAAPVGTVDGTSWYAARLNRFLVLGDTASVLQLEALAGGAAQDAYAARAVVLANLGGGDAAAACAITPPTRGTRGYSDTLAFFMQLLVYCQLRVGEFEKAGLTLELNEKTLGEDKFFRELAFLMSAQAQPVFGTQAQVDAAKQADQEPPLVVPSEVTPMQLALLQLAGQGLSVSLDKSPPYFMAALAQDYAQPTATQLGAAHLAMRADSLSSERFSQMSQLADLSFFQTVPIAASGTATDENVQTVLSANAPDAVFLADTLLKVDMAAIEDQPMVLADALRDAQERGLWLDMVEVLEDRLKALATVLDSVSLTDNPTDKFDATLNNNLDMGLPVPFDASSNAAGGVAVPVTLAAASANSGTPILADSDRAVLLPAYLALDGDIVPQSFLKTASAAGAAGAASENEAAAETALRSVSERLLAYRQINDPALDPLGDLLAGLDTPSDTPSYAPFDILGASETQASVAQNSQIDGFAALPDASDTLPADTRPHPISDWQAFEAQYESANAALQRYLNRELAVYQGLGFEVAAGFRPAQLESEPATDTAAFTAEQRLSKLADNKWIGDLLLGFIADYADRAADEMSEQDIIKLLSYLRRAGLEATAEELGAEILHHAAARLAIIAPQSLALPARSEAWR